MANAQIGISAWRVFCDSDRYRDCLKRSFRVMCFGTKSAIRNSPMNTSQNDNSDGGVLDLFPPARMTKADALDYIARTLRQLDRFDHLPKPDGETIDPVLAAKAWRMCEEIEADMRKDLHP